MVQTAGLKRWSPFLPTTFNHAVHVYNHIERVDGFFRSGAVTSFLPVDFDHKSIKISTGYALLEANMSIAFIWHYMNRQAGVNFRVS